METQNLIENASEKLKRKNLDLIAANSIREEGAGFGGDTNRVTLISANETIPLEKMSKFDTANAIINKIMEINGLY